MCKGKKEEATEAEARTQPEGMGRGADVTLAHLVLEVCVVLQDGALVGARPHVILHHVLLLGQVAIKLEQRHSNGTGHAAGRQPRPRLTLPQRQVGFGQRSTWGGRIPLRSQLFQGSGKLEAARCGGGTTTVTAQDAAGWRLGPGSHPELRYTTGGVLRSRATCPISGDPKKRRSRSNRTLGLRAPGR